MDSYTIMLLAEHIARETIDDYSDEDVERLEGIITDFFTKVLK